MAIKESAKDWYKDMHEGVYANMSKGIVPIKSPDEDSIVKSVRDKYQERSDVGKLKGITSNINGNYSLYYIRNYIACINARYNRSYNRKNS
jgi:hypothetical protein